MPFIAISGSWKDCTPVVEQDVREAVRKMDVMKDTLVTGGALGVDYFATDEALLKGVPIIVILPTSLEIYEKHYLVSAHRGRITKEQADLLIIQLRAVKEKPGCELRTMQYTECTPITYFARNTEVVKIADELWAFHVNDSHGTADAIKKAQERNIPVRPKTYQVPTESSEGQARFKQFQPAPSETPDVPAPENLTHK